LNKNFWGENEKSWKGASLSPSIDHQALEASPSPSIGHQAWGASFSLSIGHLVESFLHLLPFL